jgi:hypothetical protein
LVTGAVGAVGVAVLVAVAGALVAALTALVTGAATGAVAELMGEVAEASGATGPGVPAMARAGSAATITSSDVAAMGNRNR